MKWLRNMCVYSLVSLNMLLIALESRAFSLGYYVRAFQKYQIQEVTKLSMEQLTQIGSALIMYLLRGDNQILEPYFSQREILHMVDVYHLFRVVYILQGISLVVVILDGVYLVKKKLVMRQLSDLKKWLCLHYLLLGIGGFLYTQTDFTYVFYQFHELFFTNDLWLMNPETDLMIQMLPQGFFAQMATEIVLVWSGLILLIQLGIILWERQRIEKATRA